jgi:hypothetical protein
VWPEEELEDLACDVTCAVVESVRTDCSYD